MEMDEPLRLLDRLCGALAYPWDRLVPTAVWLALVLCVLLFARKKHDNKAWRAGIYAGAAYFVLWWLVLAGYGVMPSAARVIDAPFGPVRRALEGVLWTVVGVVGSPDPAALFGWPHQDHDWRLAVAGLGNEAALAALLGAASALIARAALRGPRRQGARRAG